jgi:hypothetical protein
VKEGHTPGVYEKWALASAEINPPKFTGQAVHKSFAKLDAVILYMGGEALYKAWTAFSAGKLDDAEELFKQGDPSGHGALRIREARANQIAAASRAEEQRRARVTQAEAEADLRVRDEAEAAARAAVRAASASAARKAGEDAAEIGSYSGGIFWCLRSTVCGMCSNKSKLVAGPHYARAYGGIGCFSGS